MSAPDFTILGATGFIGRALKEALVNQGRSVWAPKKQSPEIFEKPLGVVFYCIGMTGDYAVNPLDTVSAHVGYLVKILDHAKFDHLVYLSSTRLYDGIRLGSAKGDMSLALNPNNPRHLYDLSKALGENICLTAYQSRASVARLSCVFDYSNDAPGFLSELLARFRFEKAVKINSSPEFCRDYITLQDTILALIAIGESRSSEIFNVASGSNTFNMEIANILSKYDLKLEFSGNERAEYLPQCDIKNLQNLGVRPTNTLLSIENFAREISA